MICLVAVMPMTGYRDGPHSGNGPLEKARRKKAEVEAATMRTRVVTTPDADLSGKSLSGKSLVVNGLVMRTGGESLGAKPSTGLSPVAKVRRQTGDA